MVHAILVAVLLLAGCAQRIPSPAVEAFSFALIGDMPYGTAAEQRFEQMLRQIDDDRSIRFVLHAGDLKGGDEPCSDDLLRQRLAQLQSVRTALVFTPGDNDWTDCHRRGAGGRRPLERLDALRRLAYPDPGRSLGRAPFALQSQSGFPENTRFTYGRVAFVALHVTGSNNGLQAWGPPVAPGQPLRDEQLAAFRRREAADLAWLREAVAEARASEAVALVVLMHANPRFDLRPGDGRRTGFEAIVDAVARLAGAFGRPVLLLHGDGHLYLADRPLADYSPPAPNLRRVQAFGHPWTAWLRIDVEPAGDAVFSITMGKSHHVYP